MPRIASVLVSVVPFLLSSVSSSSSVRASERSVEASVEPPAGSVPTASPASFEPASSVSASNPHSDNPWEAERLRRRLGIGVAGELLSGQSRTYLGGAFQLEYRFSPLVSVETSLLAAGVAPEPFRTHQKAFFECDTTIEPRVWRGSGALKVHLNGVRNFDPWIGPEAGVLDVITTNTTTCGTGTTTEGREHLVMPVVGLVVGTSYWIQDATFFDLRLRAFVTTANGVAVWVSGGIGIAFHLGIP